MTSFIIVSPMEYYVHCRIELHNRKVELSKNKLKENKDLESLCSPLKTMDENWCAIWLQPIYNIWGNSCMVKPQEELK